LQERVRRAYEDNQFHLIYQLLHNFSTVDMGAFYLDVIKDRQYTTGADSLARRSAQTAMYHIAEALVRWLAPVLSFTAEEIWDHLPRVGGDPESVHLLGMPAPEPSRVDPALAERFEVILAARAAATKELESFRAQKHHSLDAAVVLGVPATHRGVLHGCAAEIHDYLIVSSVLLESVEGDAFQVTVKEHQGAKCPRCWKRTDVPARVAEWEGLCPRCAEALREMGF
jgi:isoleucyl-tRNA synthetase